MTNSLEVGHPNQNDVANLDHSLDFRLWFSQKKLSFSLNFCKPTSFVITWCFPLKIGYFKVKMWEKMSSDKHFNEPHSLEKLNDENKNQQQL